MIKTLIVLLLITGTCYAQEVNEKYSRKDMSGRTFKETPVKEFNNTRIVRAAFGIQETPDADVFPDGMTGVIFEGCNLDNCYVPEGNTIIGGTHKNVMTQNDGEDWIMEKIPAEELPPAPPTGYELRHLYRPVSPLKPDRFDKYNLSKDPKDIPDKKRTVGLVEEKIREELDAEFNISP